MEASTIVVTERVYKNLHLKFFSGGLAVVIGYGIQKIYQLIYQCLLSVRLNLLCYRSS